MIENERRTRQPGKWGKGLKCKEKDLNKNEKERCKKNSLENLERAQRMTTRQPGR